MLILRLPPRWRARAFYHHAGVAIPRLKRVSRTRSMKDLHFLIPPIEFIRHIVV